MTGPFVLLILIWNIHILFSYYKKILNSQNQIIISLTLKVLFELLTLLNTKNKIFSNNVFNDFLLNLY